MRPAEAHGLGGAPLFASPLLSGGLLWADAADGRIFDNPLLGRDRTIFGVVPLTRLPDQRAVDGVADVNRVRRYGRRGTGTPCEGVSDSLTQLQAPVADSYATGGNTDALLALAEQTRTTFGIDSTLVDDEIITVTESPTTVTVAMEPHSVWVVTLTAQ